MDDAELLELQHRSQAAYFRAIAEGHPDSFVRTLSGGVQATVVPVSPWRSLPNSVLYDAPGAVIEHHDELVSLYEEAGVNAWTVWVRPGDDELAAQLEERGHALDGTPMIMGAAIDELDLAPRLELDLDPAPLWDVAGAINDEAYGLEPGSLRAPLGGIPATSAPLLIARSDGAAVACAAFLTTGTDCEAGFVATLPQARGRGLGAELMREGLRRGRDAGATTATLEASAMGRPVYERIGYRALAPARMMERRAQIA